MSVARAPSPVAARAPTVPIAEHLEHGESDDEGDDNDRLHPGFGVPVKQSVSFLAQTPQVP